MKFEVQIGDSHRDQSNYTDQWIYEQFSNRNSDNSSFCVRVSISTEKIRIGLATQNCQSTHRSGRPLTFEENDIINTWKSLKLNDNNISPKNLIVFIKNLR